MVTYDKENVLQTSDGDLTIGVGEGQFFLNVYGATPRTYNKMTLTKADLRKLREIIQRLDSDPIE